MTPYEEALKAAMERGWVCRDDFRDGWDAANNYRALEKKGTPAVLTPPRVRPDFSVDPRNYN